MLTRRRCTMVAAAVLLGAMGVAAWPDTANAGKTPPPPNFGGAILYTAQNQIWAMNGDGSGKQAVTPPSIGGVPSSVDHGGHTWWLAARDVPGGGFYPGTTAPEQELYVFRTNSLGELATIQLTSLLTAGTNGRGIVPGAVSWSNDGADSFVSFSGYDIGSATSYVFRADIHFPTAGAPSIDAPVPIVASPPGASPIHWSPDGQNFVYAVNGRGLWVYHLGDERQR